MVDVDALFKVGDAAQDVGDFTAALHAFERGAALGSTSCLERLAYMYDVGVGVEVDKKLAISLYRRAWRRDGSIVAAHNIAILYRELGRRRDMFRWFQRAAQSDDGSSQLELAKCYRDGEGVRANIQIALQCLAIAERSRHISDDELDEVRALQDVLAQHHP